MFRAKKHHKSDAGSFLTCLFGTERLTVQFPFAEKTRLLYPHPMSGSEPEANGAPLFPLTRWTMIIASAETSAPGAADALAELCRAYWRPLYAYLRGRGADSHLAQDQVQGFFLHLLEDRVIARADRQRGRFRTFLLTCLRNFLSHEYQQSCALKRGGGVEIVALDAMEIAEFERQAPAAEADPERAFDVEWALAVVSRSRRKMREESLARGKGKLFDSLADFLPGAPVATLEEPWAQTADRLGVPVPALKSSVRRLRERFRECLREEVALTVEFPDEIDEELRHLRETLTHALQERAVREL